MLFCHLAVDKVSFFIVTKWRFLYRQSVIFTWFIY